MKRHQPAVDIEHTRKELRVAYINRIYEAEKRQVHDEFEVRLHARFF